MVIYLKFSSVEWTPRTIYREFISIIKVLYVFLSGLGRLFQHSQSVRLFDHL